MRAVILRSFVVIAAGALILAGVLFVASTVDARPPQVLGIELTQPAGDDTREALITTSIEVTFSEPVEQESAAEAVGLEPDVDGSVSWSGSTLIYTPHEPLELETEYELVIEEGIEDLSGNEMSETPPPFTFTTAGRPNVVESLPADGADEVAVDEVVSVTFSTLMDTASVEAELTLDPAFDHELRWSGELLEIVPTEPLEPDREYRVEIGAEAADIAGVTLGEVEEIAFTTVAPGLQVTGLVPVDGVDGVASTTPIAVIFDRPLAAQTVGSDALQITPAVAGTLEVVPLAGEEPPEEGSGSVLRFTPSGPLPANTTFELELAPGLESTRGGQLAEPVAWTFTTGPPATTLSNQITFLSERAGVANVWAMNADGTGQRQVSAELAGVVDYVVAPDGSSLVVADGRRLVFIRADGLERRVLTDEVHVEFDPAYTPNGQFLAFGRADAATGDGMGLWQWEVGAAEASPIQMPPDVLGGPAGSPVPDGEPMPWLRAPRYAPDGQALAFVDGAGNLGILELPNERLTVAQYHASGTPAWLPDSTAVVVSGDDDGPEWGDVPVEPLVPGEESEVGVMYRSGTRVAESGFGSNVRLAAVAPDGRIAYLDAGGTLRVAESPDRIGRVSPGLSGVTIGAVAFAPGEAALVVLVLDEPDAVAGRLERLEIGSGQRSELAEGGWRPRWQP